LSRELNFAINKITAREIYHTDQESHQEALNAILRRPSVRHKKSTMIKWMNEYSESGANERGTAKRDTHESQMIPVIRLEGDAERVAEESEESDEVVDQSIRQLYSELEGIQLLLNDGDNSFNSRKFDLFAFSKHVGREKTLPILALNLFLQHQLISLVNEPKFAQFMNEVYRTYLQSVQYHNDLHGIDVAHMGHLFLT
jgi:hypothetical protein